MKPLTARSANLGTLADSRWILAQILATRCRRSSLRARARRRQLSSQSTNETRNRKRDAQGAAGRELALPHVDLLPQGGLAEHVAERLDVRPDVARADEAQRAHAVRADDDDGRAARAVVSCRPIIRAARERWTHRQSHQRVGRIVSLAYPRRAKCMLDGKVPPAALEL